MMRPALLKRTLDLTAAPMLRRIGIAIFAGALLAALGPFGSYMNGGLVQRAGYWIAAMLLGLALYGTALRAVVAFAPAGSRLWWPWLISATLLASVPEALATRTGAFWLWPELTKLGLSWPLWFAQTTTIGLVAMLGAGFLLRRSAPKPQDNPASSPSIRTGARLLSKDVLALQMEDHYVRVHRPNGSELILMPLSQAMACMEAEGLRIHRSWWVAGHAVLAVEGNARSMRVRLSNGVVAPVARSAIIHLKAAGWIADRESDGRLTDRNALF